MAHDVFISYAQNDKPTADAVCHGLESAGIRCWIAPRDVPAGSNWKTQLVEAIRHARVMVLVFSSEADRSPQVMREVDIAFESGAPIVPFRIEDVKMSDEMYYCIAARHWLDALNPPLEEHTARLTAAVRAIVDARPVAGDPATISAAEVASAPPPAQLEPETPARVVSRPIPVPPPIATATEASDPPPATVRRATGAAQAGATDPSKIPGWTVGLLAIAAAVLLAGAFALRGWIGNEDAAIVIAILGGAFVVARRRRRR
jgi:hypothetical protein